SYIEAHGTGTPLGDPIEVQALTKAFRASTNRNQFCALGSVKTNIGHLDAAAGVAGLIKTVLALKHKMLPASLHFKEANPKIDFDSTPFYVNTGLREWERAETPRRAGVSAFGVGGTNAHVIGEERPEVEESGQSREWQMVMMSAKTEEGLEKSTQRMREYLVGSEEKLSDISYTTQVGRRVMRHRRVVICRSK